MESLPDNVSYLHSASKHHPGRDNIERKTIDWEAKFLQDHDALLQISISLAKTNEMLSRALVRQTSLPKADIDDTSPDYLAQFTMSQEEVEAYLAVPPASGEWEPYENWR